MKFRSNFVFVMMLSVFLATGCSGTVSLPDQEPSATSGSSGSAIPSVDPVTVTVFPDQPFSAEIPHLGRLAGDAGAFASEGTVTLTPRADADDGALLRSAGPGLDVTFTSTKPIKALHLSFPVTEEPKPGELPVVLHTGKDGTVDVLPAERDATGAFTVDTRSFSEVGPAWANPADLWRILGDKLASAVGGRTDPLNCKGAPDWFHLDDRHSDLLHVCATTVDQDDVDVAEVRLKSNRGVSIEVTVPGSPVYVKVQDQSWRSRQWYGRQLSFDPNRTVILPAGATMYVGYEQSYAKGPFSFFVTGVTVKAVTDSTIRSLMDFLIGEIDSTVVLYTQAKCATGLSLGPVGIVAGVAEWHDFMSCWTGALAEELSDADNALKVVSSVQGKIDKGEESKAVKNLVRYGKALKKLGWLVKLWPAFQIGIGNDVDKVRELLTGGESAQVTYRTDPRKNPPTLAELSLSPEGLGPLRMGITAKAAEASRMVVRNDHYCDPALHGAKVEPTHWEPSAFYSRNSEDRAPWAVGFGRGTNQQQRKLIEIEVHSDQIRTTQGVSVGDLLSKLRRAYGDQLKEKQQPPEWGPVDSRVFHVDSGPNSLIFEVGIPGGSNWPADRIWMMRTEPSSYYHYTLSGTDGGVGACAER